MTDAEINEARAPHIGLPLKCWPQHRAIAGASQTVTLKAVAEWLEGLLHEDDQKGLGEWMLIDDNDMLGLKEGKMPGEE